MDESRIKMTIQRPNPEKTTVYSKNQCVQCKMTKRFLDTNHVEYREINLDEQPEYIDHVKSLGFNAAPVVQTPTEAFSGFQPGKLKKLS